ncbi:hypothetical protein COK18_07855 [Bacillus cereus]|uniref:hypothetical protein n=1 Tax=Bacillus cereus TaxID=1396 RepID=UPI000BF8B2AA|nr:hypothetical protein [Bacillus cereus]MBZ3765682.1 hypothetical protein [Bacillus cereus]PFQ65885.1 hypothetical protein COK18_07855 [Bacillus cereus]
MKNNQEKKIPAPVGTDAETNDVNLNGCTQCGRGWKNSPVYCGFCGHRLVPVRELSEFFPGRNFPRVD